MRSPRQLYVFLSLLWFVGVVWLAFQWQKSMLHKPSIPFCAFKLTTGHPCPACGTTRAIVLILEGRFYEAVALNPLGFLSFTGLVVFPVWLIYDFWDKKQSLWHFWNAFEKIMRIPFVYIPLIVLVLLNWIWNVYKGL